MKSSEFAKLKNGHRVRHFDGTWGTIERNPNYSKSLMEIVWDDGQRQMMCVDTKTDCDWIESDIVEAATA